MYQCLTFGRLRMQFPFVCVSGSRNSSRETQVFGIPPTSLLSFAHLISNAFRAAEPTCVRSRSHFSRPSPRSPSLHLPTLVSLNKSLSLIGNVLSLALIFSDICHKLTHVYPSLIISETRDPYGSHDRKTPPLRLLRS
jgi:hypothetical protein